MKETEYYKSGQHTNNAKLAQIKAREVQQKNKQVRINEYHSNPKYCLFVDCPNCIEYHKQGTKFCSKRCAAKHNMAIRTETGWTHSQESKAKASAAMAGRARGTPAKPRSKKPREQRTCPVCSIGFEVLPSSSRKSCGAKECLTHLKIGVRTYQNGKRKLIKYWNTWTNSQVILESSWEHELALWLDEKKISWERPSFLVWIDPTGKNRQYYPDFYLPERDIYLDPKNPYCIVQDKDKLAYFVDKVTIHYGAVQHIKDQIYDETKIPVPR